MKSTLAPLEAWSPIDDLHEAAKLTRAAATAADGVLLVKTGYGAKATALVAFAKSVGLSACADYQGGDGGWYVYICPAKKCAA